MITPPLSSSTENRLFVIIDLNSQGHFAKILQGPQGYVLLVVAS